MIRYAVARPSLKIIGRADHERASRFIFRVWSPFARAYQPVASVEEGLHRVLELASLIGRMTLRQHPKLALLADVPEADALERARWAEFRITTA